ncbi:unnamed protein product [Clavelina lepadiformis]|uniref:Uncharacterized protein n=1 Tax=Clavelina lepadiformis TaxID=159417 RepID=A0ABP0GVU0_CLALP
MNKLLFFVGLLLLLSFTEVSSFTCGLLGCRGVRDWDDLKKRINTEISNELTDTQDRARRNVAEEKDEKRFEPRWGK